MHIVTYQGLHVGGGGVCVICLQFIIYVRLFLVVLLLALPEFKTFKYAP